MICSQCNKEFDKTHHRQKYCSKECAAIIRKNKVKNYMKEFKRLGKYNESVKKYRQTDKYKITKKIYEKGEKHKKALKKVQQSDKHKNNRKKYLKQQRETDPLFKLIGTVRSRLYKFIKTSSIPKKNKTFEMVGCTPEFLKKHLEKQFHRHPDYHHPMNWLNYTVHGWHIDHIIPLDSAKTPEDVEKLMHYTNLQPMWAEYNIKKGNKII